MPDHFHGILSIVDLDKPGKGGSQPALTGAISIKPLGQLISAFKTISSKKINQYRSTPGERLWHRGYFEHIIRNVHE